MSKYNRQQLQKVWWSVDFREDRYWAFLKRDGGWWHTDSKNSKLKTFDNYEQFENCVHNMCVQDIHVKMTVDGGREWIIDIDHDEKNPARLMLKNMIAHSTLTRFFGPSCVRVLFSGNRGLHIWLDRNQFDMKACKELREYYYDTLLKKPTRIVKPFVREGSLNDCFLKSFDNAWIKREISHLYHDINLNDTAILVKEFFPYVDKQIFVSTKQIRAPYSFNTKGNNYSCDHVLLLE
ncbi:late expression factor 1 [Diatraea saccharalis granulovirus]|uniref:Late expression factor 1 n=1 Tax=Diatraea saccharalis granulovirus TaxID=1675862 RepID=A0A0R7EZ01_9BBAC|nr:late expression factor 1 [Diatraea saccharalis granulovirus]AKN80799.1 late expression factor 1 [Diatraea saccharalis granulovirus]